MSCCLAMPASLDRLALTPGWPARANRTRPSNRSAATAGAAGRVGRRDRDAGAAGRAGARSVMALLDLPLGRVLAGRNPNPRRVAGARALRAVDELAPMPRHGF